MEKPLIETVFARQTEEFAASRAFAALESGAATRADYDDFIAALCRTHLKSPHILAFLFSGAPPAAADNLKHNLLEELGLDAPDGPSHPAMLLELAAYAGFDEARRARLQTQAQENLRRMISEPLLFGSLRDVGLSVLVETVAYEWMLSRTAGRMAAFLNKHRGLERAALEWFYHHSEVDLKHAAEGVQAILDYVAYYEFAPADAELIVELTFRENVFIKRYFNESHFAESAGGVS